MMSFNFGVLEAILSRVGTCGSEQTTEASSPWLMMYSVVSGPRVS